MSLLEIIAVALGIVNVALVVRRSLWNYPFGIVMVVLYAHIFFGARLYSDALLQVFFLVVQLYGWVHWHRAAAAAGEVRVERLGPPARLAWLAGVAVATMIWGWAMHHFTDAAFPWWDAGVAILSVAAQLLMSRRFLENWVLWIAVDLLAIGLYAAKDLWLTAGLYAIFLGLAVWGLIDWRGAERRMAIA
ncbi:MAG: nicotinamide mononucleotide transporter [Sphingomonas bacterium]|uniref:nicotinamide riboside transporter PnuC n=1 Tax=Sphingomonas bacterium TaxID=1895847 RepID=UPI002623D050|nr:nicotinamide riboside transporter PnuC [Sphingomonas bacterium]MDB5706332.1 nicotinamide mononucleotide transporter [Sphingomonas bacterium]